MTDTITKLRKINLTARKEDPEMGKFLTFVLSEVLNVGKNDGNRDTTDEEAQKTIRKVIAKNDEEVKFAKDGGEMIRRQNALLETILPQQVSMSEVEGFLMEQFGGDNRPANLGPVMKALRDQYGALVDMKQAGALAKTMFGF
jgi:uncharacterized protein YqeY